MAKKTLPGPAARMLTELKIRHADASKETWDELEAKLNETIVVYGAEKGDLLRQEFSRIRVEAELGRTRRASVRSIVKGDFDVVAFNEVLEGFQRPAHLFRLRLDTGDVALLTDVVSRPGVPDQSCPTCGRKLEALDTSSVGIPHKPACSRRS